MSKKIVVILVCLFLLAVASEKTFDTVSPDQISIPQLLNYQGKLTETNGNPVRDSIYSITFRFFSGATGGTAFWAENQSIQTHVGLFNSLLGSTTPITSIPSDGNCYLEMQVNPNPAMTPRIRIVSSAYSFLAKKADTANYATSAPLTRPITPPVATNEINDGAVNSAKILDGSITRTDVTNNFKSPYSDTADYARAVTVQYVDSTRVAANAYKLQGKDTIDLSAKFVDEGQVNAISNTMIINGAINTAKLTDSAVTNQKIADNAISSNKIVDGTIIRADVVNNFKSPYSDTADFSRGVNIQFIDSSRVSVNTYMLQGKDTSALSVKFVDEGQANSISSGMIIDGTISRQDVATNFKSPYADTSDYARNVFVPYVDSARISTNTHQLQGNDITALDGRFVNEGQLNSVTNPMITNNAVTMDKIDQSSATTGQVIKWNGTAWIPGTDSATGQPIGPAGGDLTGNYPNPAITNNAINSAKISDGSILGDDIAKPLNLRGTVSWPGAILHIRNNGTGRGISIDSAGFVGVHINYAFTDGVNVARADQSGFSVDTAGGTGVRIISSGTDAIGIDNTGWDGIYIQSAGLHGVEATDVAESGLYVIHAGDNGVKIDSAENYGVYAYGNLAGAKFIASNASANGLIAHSYGNAVNDTAIQAYGRGYATGGWYTGGLLGDKEAPCLISPELGIVTAGTGTLTNGKAEINFDPLFERNIRTDIPIRITVTPKGKPAGFIYVTETKSSGFRVELEPIPGLEKNTTDITFDWIAFGTLKEYQTSPEAQAQWQKMLRERDAKRAEAKTRNQERNRMLEQHK